MSNHLSVGLLCCNMTLESPKLVYIAGTPMLTIFSMSLEKTWCKDAKNNVWLVYNFSFEWKESFLEDNLKNTNVCAFNLTVTCFPNIFNMERPIPSESYRFPTMCKSLEEVMKDEFESSLWKICTFHFIFSLSNLFFLSFTFSSL